MAYVLATTENIVHWYSFDIKTGQNCVKLEHLDLSKVPQFGDKESAKEAAKALDLKTWRYVKI